MSWHSHAHRSVGKGRSPTCRTERSLKRRPSGLKPPRIAVAGGTAVTAESANPLREGHTREVRSSESGPFHEMALRRFINASEENAGTPCEEGIAGPVV